MDVKYVSAIPRKFCSIKVGKASPLKREVIFEQQTSFGNSQGTAHKFPATSNGFQTKPP